MSHRPEHRADPELLEAEGYVRDPALERRILGFLFGLTVLGLLGFGAAVVNGVIAQTTSAEEVRRNAELIRQLTALEEAQSADVTEHRERNEELHADLCRIVYEVAQRAAIKVTPCRDPLMPGEAVNGSVDVTPPVPPVSPDPAPTR